jgi:hypothetical protein
MSLPQAIRSAMQFVGDHPETMTRAEVNELCRLADAVYDLAHAAGLLDALPKVTELLPQLQSDEPSPVQFESKLNLPGDWVRPAPLNDGEYQDWIVQRRQDPEPEPPTEPVFRVCVPPRWWADMETLLRRKPEESFHDPAPAPPAPRLRVEEGVLLDGGRIALDMTEEARGAALCLLTHLLAAGGDWRSRTDLDDMEKSGPCKVHIGIRWDRVFKRLPPCILALVESNRRKGYRLISAGWHR